MKLFPFAARGLGFLLVLFFSCVVSAQPAKLRVILVGDSTMATRSGYGDALCARFTEQVTCLNLARGGRSSGSYRAEGLWDQVMHLLRQPDGKQSFVLIQFGHNDQPGKPGRSTDLQTEFPANLQRYVREVKEAGGQPLLLTPLTRRSFRSGVLENHLLPWAEVVTQVAHSDGVLCLPLNAESYAMVQAMGEAEADTLAMAPRPDLEAANKVASLARDSVKSEPAGAAKSAFDRTHLGVKGAALFSELVLQLWLRSDPQMQRYLAPSQRLGEQP